VPQALLQILDAVAAEITASGIVPAESVAVSFAPDYEAIDLAGLVVAVAPNERPISEEPFSRASADASILVDVGFLARAETDDAVRVLLDQFLRLTHYLRRRPLAAFPAAAWTNTQVHTPAWADKLRENRIYLAVATFTYHVEIKDS